MKVLITGGTGTISSGLVKECVSKKYETYAITRGLNNSRNIAGATYLKCDVWNVDEMSKVLEDNQFDVVVECLAYNVKQLQISLTNFASKTKQYIFISSASIYNHIGNQRIKETDKKELIEWAYTKNKIQCENYLKNYSEEKGLKYTIVRPTVTYGNYRIPFPIITRTPSWTFFDRLQKGKLMLASDNVLFSIIHIDDFSKMVIALFNNPQAINEDFHITSNDNDIYWDDVIKEGAKILEVEPKIIHVSSETFKKLWPSMYNELKYHKNNTQIFDDTKIKTVTKINTELNLEEGMRKIIPSMEKEYFSKNMSLDEKWNTYCNAVIFYAYKNNLLNSNEMILVEEYIKANGIKEFKDSINAVKKDNMQAKKKAVIHKLKTLLKI